MKKISILSTLLVIFLSHAISKTCVHPTARLHQPDVDLRLPTIEHPHALCAGSTNKIVVTVSYGNGTVIKERIKVVLHIIQAGEAKVYAQTIAGINGGYAKKYTSRLLSNIKATSKSEPL